MRSPAPHHDQPTAPVDVHRVTRHPLVDQRYKDLTLYALPGSALADAGRAHGLKVVDEYFADRPYKARTSSCSAETSMTSARLPTPPTGSRRCLRMTVSIPSKPSAHTAIPQAHRSSWPRSVAG
ncbi:LamB/YcsF family protein [Amycolatopsis sp. NPDC004368]